MSCDRGMWSKSCDQKQNVSKARLKVFVAFQQKLGKEVLPDTPGKNHLLTLKLSSDQPMSPRRLRSFLSTWLIYMSNPGLPVLQKIENYKSGLTMAFEIQGAWFPSQKRDFQMPIVTSFRDVWLDEFREISKFSFSSWNGQFRGKFIKMIRMNF